MNPTRFLVIALAALSLQASAAATKIVAKIELEQALIHFPSLGGIRTWRAVGDDALYIEGRNSQWYFVRLVSPCQGLNTTGVIGFVTEPEGDLDRFSAVLVNHTECRVMSLVKADQKPSN